MTTAGNETGDLYAILEVPRDANADAIHAAFRALAAANHPDRHGGDPAAARRFKRINAAYQVLSDPRRREAYDDLTRSVHFDEEPVPRQPLHVPPAQQTMCRRCGRYVNNAELCAECAGAQSQQWRSPAGPNDDGMWSTDARGIWHHPRRGSWFRDGNGQWHPFRAPVPPRSSSGSALGRVIGIIASFSVIALWRGGAFDSCSEPHSAYSTAPKSPPSSVSEVTPLTPSQRTHVGDDFDVTFPSPPTTSSSVDVSAAIPITMHTLTATAGSHDGGFMAIFGDYLAPASTKWDATKVLSSARDGMLANASQTKGVTATKVVIDEARPLGALPGRYIVARISPGLTMHAHLGFRQDPSPRLYGFMAIQDASGKPTDDDVERFFGSITSTK